MRRTPLIRLLLFVILCLLPSLALAQDQGSEPTLSSEVAHQLVPLKYKAEAAIEMDAEGIISPMQKDAALEYYTDVASQAAGEPVDVATLLAIDATALGNAAGEPGVGSKILGFFTFTNIMLVLASIVFVVAFFIFFGHLLIDVILAIPKLAWEVFFYILSVAVMVYGTTLGEDLSNYVGFAGGALLAGSLGFTVGTRKQWKGNSKAQFYFGTLLVVTLALAFIYESALIAGLLAIPALMGLMGFSVMMWPGVIGIGFTEEDAVPRGTFTGLAILVLFVAMRMGLIDVIPELAIFETGSLYWGSFVGFLGLLILSSKWYKKETWILFNGLTLVMGIAALAIGSIWGIPELQKIGGTFFVIWGCEKYFEIPAKDIIGWSFLLMVFSGLTWAFMAFLKAHPDIAATWLLF